MGVRGFNLIGLLKDGGVPTFYRSSPLAALACSCSESCGCADNMPRPKLKSVPVGSRLRVEVGTFRHSFAVDFDTFWASLRQLRHAFREAKPGKPPLRALRHLASTLRHGFNIPFPNFDTPAASLKKRGRRRVRFQPEPLLPTWEAGSGSSDVVRSSRRPSAP
jgi:hypothetical protein